jgi:hypothetical protein
MDRVVVVSERSAIDCAVHTPMVGDVGGVNVIGSVDQRDDITSAGWVGFKRGGER